jgi:phosphatidylserine/phosphatidylglycerophosphate/cardiolipin synthase-like enzyme
MGIQVRGTSAPSDFRSDLKRSKWTTRSAASALAFATFLTAGTALFSSIATAAEPTFRRGSAINKETFPEGLVIHGTQKGVPHFELVGRAMRTLDIAIYEMKDVRFRTEVRAAIKRGVRVRIVHEPQPIGATCDLNGENPASSTDPACLDLRSLASEAVRAGGAFKLFNKAELCGEISKPSPTNPTKSLPPCFLHGKMIIADGQFALLSTGNFNSSSLCEPNAKVCNREYSFLLKSDREVRALQAVFEKDLLGKSFPLAQVASAAPALTFSPIARGQLMKMIDSARNELWLQNQYITDTGFLERLVAASKRGVRVKLMLASACAFSKPDPTQRQKYTQLFEQLERNGIEVRMFPSDLKVGGKDGYLHSKAILMDGRTGWVGSINGSTTAIDRNREFGIFFSSPSDVNRLQSQLKSDFNHSDSETWQEALDCKRDRPRDGSGTPQFR